MCVRIRRTISCGHNFKKPIRTYKTREDRISKKRIKMKNKTGMTENRVRRRRFDKQLFSRVRLLQKVENVHVRDRGWGLEIKMSNSEIHMPNKKKKPVNKRRMRNCAVTETCETIVQLQFVSLHLDKATMIVLDRSAQFFFWNGNQWNFIAHLGPIIFRKHSTLSCLHRNLFAVIHEHNEKPRFETHTFHYASPKCRRRANFQIIYRNL